jgi:hypothetical protein
MSGKSWVKKGDSDALLEEIEAARERVRVAASDVRHCPNPDCDRGYTYETKERLDHLYTCIRRHGCRERYIAEVDRLRWAVVEFEKATGSEYRSPMTYDMKDLSRPGGQVISEERWKVWCHKMAKAFYGSMDIPEV